MRSTTAPLQRLANGGLSTAVAALFVLVLAMAALSVDAATPVRSTTPSASLASSAMEQFVLGRATGLPGKVGVRFDLAMLQALPACSAPEPFLPAGARLWGRVSIGVRCSTEQPWVRYVPAHVSVTGGYYVAARLIGVGQLLSLADVQAREGDLTALPASVIVDVAQISGMVARNRIASGAPLRQEFLRALVIVQQGQIVKVVSQGVGFTISTEGRAMTQAAAGALLQVKTHGGGMVSGIVQSDGVLERSP
jgi:flagella basal body P-ring formation protein FlgA